MKTRFLIATAWLRRQVAWSNTRRSWQERLGFLGLIAAGITGWYVSQNWSPEQRIVLLAAWLLGLALLLRRGLFKLFGPIFFYEVLRGSRRRVHLVRTLFATILALTIGYVFVIRSEYYYSTRNTMQVQAETAEVVFLVFFCALLGLVTILTPLMVAGAISEEKERRTLEFILATDLRSREIILGKLAGRLANMALFLLAGLPLLSLLQLMGGIDPGLLLVGFAAVLISFISLAALSIWHSTLLRRSRDAIVTTFITILGYIALSSVARLLLFTPFANWSLPLIKWTIDGRDVIDAIGAGNIFIQISRLGDQLYSSGSFNSVLPQILKEFAIFHGATTFLMLGWAMLRLRPIASAQGTAGETRRSRRRFRYHPAVGSHPMIWKEVFVEPGMRLHWVAKIIVILIILASFYPAVEITIENWDGLISYPQGYWMTGERDYWRYYNDQRYAWLIYQREMNAWVRGMCGVVGTLLLLAVAVRAAGSITGERARQTFDELLSSPLSNREIIHGKWLGSVLSVRRGAIWLGLTLAIGFWSGGVNWLGIFLVLVCWLVYASFLAMLGVWFSTVCRNTFRATVITILASIMALGGHWLISALCCFLPMSLSRGNYDSDTRELGKWAVAMQAGITPPFVLGVAPMQEMGELYRIHDDDTKFVFFAFVGLGVFVVATLVLRYNLLFRFATVTSRSDLRRPEQKLAPFLETMTKEDQNEVRSEDVPLAEPADDAQ
jgi:ABC-type transport system involved in multi-copper enzyme maturation permease subunit